MRNSIVSKPFVFSQSYKEDNLGNPELYSESFSVAKITTNNSKNLLLKDITQFIGTYWRKTASDVDVKLGFIFGNDLEKDYFKTGLNINKTGNTLITPATKEECIISSSNVQEIPVRFIYNAISITSLDDYQDACAYMNVNQNKFFYPIQKDNMSRLPDVELENEQGLPYLYIIPYSPILARTELYLAGTIQFKLEEG